MGDQYIFTNIYAHRETRRGRKNERISYNGNTDGGKKARKRDRWRDGQESIERRDSVGKVKHRGRGRDSLEERNEEERKSAALMAKSELNEQRRQAVIMANPI